MANQELAELTTKRNKTFSTGLINGNGFTNGEGTSRALTVRNPSDGLTNGAGTKSALTLHNSNGLVNGNGLTNGNGLSNGNGLTNGNGFTNGNSHLGRSPKQSHIDLIKTRNFKNKIISIIATIILIIAPLYLYTIEISKETEKNILIDGEFNDWQDIAGISDRHNDQNINPNVDIDNFKVKSDHKAGTLSFYLSVHGIMLKGKRVSDSNSDEVQNYAYGLDTVHIFIDIDHSSETGYIFKNIGADYLLQIQGYNGWVTEAVLMIFDNARNQNDWNGWLYVAEALTKCRDRRLEAKVWLSELIINHPEKSAPSIYFHIQDSDGNEDWADELITNRPEYLVVTQKNIAPEILTEDISEVLELEFTAYGKDITVNSITLSHEGSGELTTIPTQIKINKGQTSLQVVQLDTSSSQISEFTAVKIVAREDITVEKDVPVFLHGTGSYAYIQAPPEEINIDGAFGDWQNVPAQKDVELSKIKNENIDLNEYRIAQTGEDISFYFKVKGTMMGGTYVPLAPAYIFEERAPQTIQPKLAKTAQNQPQKLTDEVKQQLPIPEIFGEDTAYIFLDTDLNSATGFNIDGSTIGAEYLIQITGKNGMIISHKYYSFTNNQERFILASNSYNWTYLGEVPVGLDSSRLETQLDLTNLGLGAINCEGMKVYFYFKDWHQTRDAIPDHNGFLTVSEEDNFYGTRGSGQPLNELVSGVGANTGDGFGWNVSTAGDVNKDGYSDFIIGAPYTDSITNDAGAVYIFYGFPGISSTTIDAVNANVSIKGNVGGDLFGWDVACAGDLNADGYDDIIVGAHGNDSYRGTAYIFYGRDAKAWQGGYYAYQANITITGETQGDRFGYSVSSAGNVNADEFDDVIIGAPGVESNKGKAYIFLGFGGGLNDIVVGSSDSRIFVAKGKYNGGWVSPLELYATAMPIWVVVADANNDGYNDIVSADFYGHRVTIFNGTSTGGWEPKCELKGDQYPRSVVVADVNNDNLNDIVTCHELANNVNIYNGSGGGGWSAMSSFSVGQGPRSVYVGDANNDGKNDFVTANNDDDTITLYNWTGTTWGQKTTFSAGDGARSIFIADANYDTYNDILTADTLDDTFTIYNGTSAGGWEPKYNKTVGDGPYCIFVADVNLDGINDTLTSDYNDSNVTIYNGTAGGDWESKFTLPVGYWPRAVFVGDANNDGYMDILTADNWDDRVSIYNGTSSGGWEPRGVVDGGNGPCSVWVGDVNNAKGGGTFQADDAEYILLGSTSNSYFGNSVSTAGDLNGDGIDDMIVGAYGEDKSYIYFGDSIHLGTTKFCQPMTKGIADTTSSDINDLKINDNWYYDIPKQTTLFIDSFNVTGLIGNITSVLLNVQYYTDSSYTPDKYIKWALDGQTLRNTTMQVIENGLEVNPWGYNLYELGVDNISEIQTLDIQFYNSDSGGQCGVYFDYLWLEVKTNSPRPDLVLNGSGDFGWTVANAGDVNNDDIDDLLIGAPDTSGSTPGYAYIKYGNHQGFDNETTGSSPAGWTQYGVLTAKINDTVAYGGTGKSLDFIDMDDPDNIEIRKTFPQSYKGIIEFYARTWNDFETNLQFELSNGAATTEANRSVYIYFGKSTGQSSSINYYSGIDGSNNAVIRIGEYEQDPWYHFKIIFDCETDTFEVYIDDVLNGINSNFIWTNDHDYLDTFTIKSNFVFGSTRGYVDNIVWLGSPPDISLSGAVNGDRFGYSVANAGDLGGDGFDDVVIGAPYNDSAIGNIADAGAAYIFYGNSSMGDAQANNADNISYGKTANDHFGWSVSKANNIDGDNLLEIMVGAPHFNDGAKTDAGKVYVLTAGFVIPEFFNLAIPLFIILIFIAILKSKAKKNKKIKVGELNEK